MTGNFICPTCGKVMKRDLAIIVPHTESHIIDVIKKKHPEWIDADGICKRCYDYYKKQLPPDVNET